MHHHFGRFSRSDGSATPPAEPADEAAIDLDAEPEPHLSLVETIPSPDAEPVEAVEPASVAEPELEPAVVVESAEPDAFVEIAIPAIPAIPAVPVVPVASVVPGPAEAWPTVDADAAPAKPAAARRGRNGDPAPVGLTAPTAPIGWTDPMTSADGPHYWDRLISSERDRIRRYQRPATIVFIELGNLDQLGALWGEDVAAQSLIKVGRTLMGEIRSSDHAARIDLARFGVFLPETNEIAAINFVERVRAAIDRSLGFMDQTLRVGIGWASPADADIDVALTVAEQRLDADLGRD